MGRAVATRERRAGPGHALGWLLAFLLAPLALALPAAGEPAAGPPVGPPPAPDFAAYPWAYLRDGRPLAAGEEVVSLLLVGDVMPGRGVASAPDPLAEVGWLAAADLTLGNLEAVLAPSSLPPRATPAEGPGPILLRADPAAAADLARAGFDLLGAANNHALDYGTAGLAATEAALARASITAIGATADGAVAPTIRGVGGLRLAFLAFNAVPDPAPDLACPPPTPCAPRPVAWERATALAAVAAAQVRADAVIVSLHWGYEYDPRPDPAQEEIARALVAAGAALVVGHHPHVAQPLAVVGDALIAFSLGNFLFDQGGAGPEGSAGGGETGRGLALHALFDEQGLRAVRALPVRAGPLPALPPPAEAGWLETLLPPPPRVGFACDSAGCRPAPTPPTTSSGRAGAGRFVSGQVDLTGDGVPELVRLAGARATVYEAGIAAWESPPDWRVIDAALGDPNDDGRHEIMLAIWRPDGAGHERSQPYLVGHRGGEYRLLWGGRPVVDPIRELAVGDVDGDGADELVVIEERADGSGRAVSVWDWAGWTFGLAWRSPPGAYRDLVLGESEAGPMRLSVVRPLGDAPELP